MTERKNDGATLQDAFENQVDNWRVRAETAELALQAAEQRERGLRQLVLGCQSDLAAYIVPDSGISEHDILNTLLGRLDGSQTRAALSAQPKEHAAPGCGGPALAASLVSTESPAAEHSPDAATLRDGERPSEK